MEEIYEPKFVEKLFDKMSNSYEYMNYITSFGYSERWRKKCVEEINIEKGKTVVDLMTGMGECWKHILKEGDTNTTLIALDFSSEMIRRATLNKKKFEGAKIEILKENVFKNSIPNQTADYVISGFGMKTFNDIQLVALANEIDRILKPDGSFSLIDVSVPKSNFLKHFYMFYLNHTVPLLGKLFLGSPETYKMLGIYTREFNNSENVLRLFNRPNFEISYVHYFFGCATGIKGRKI
ncbi:class I SAM-dependent methyltransferase [Cellulophaga sp. E16_2]|uniref:class I SAM-dependent methyltransferase n=1 Tax=unclassified Cellulophaga TaxID=2634405 RepID=UPI0013FD323C|nr:MULTISPECIES: class I SAM-dependent methyltransferase [unclassified Cellulophaga]MBO0591603.1 class I SAM-dependent methyltransferase [Cellulophaga sp. E16_2]